MKKKKIDRNIYDSLFWRVNKKAKNLLKKLNRGVYLLIKDLQMKKAGNFLVEEPDVGYTIKTSVYVSPSSKNIEDLYKEKICYSLYNPEEETVYLDDNLVLDSDLIELVNLYFQIYVLKILTLRKKGETIINRINKRISSLYGVPQYASIEVANFFGDIHNFDPYSNMKRRTLYILIREEGIDLVRIYSQIRDFLFENKRRIYYSLYKEQYESLKLENKLTLDPNIKKLLKKVSYLRYSFYLSLPKLYNEFLNPFKRKRIQREKEIFESIFKMELENIKKYDFEYLIGEKFVFILEKIKKLPIKELDSYKTRSLLYLIENNLEYFKKEEKIEEMKKRGMTF